MYGNVSARDIGHVWRSGVTNERIFDVSVLSGMIEIRICLKTCDIFSNDNSNDVITEITVF